MLPRNEQIEGKTKTKKLKTNKWKEEREKNHIPIYWWVSYCIRQLPFYALGKMFKKCLLLLKHFRNVLRELLFFLHFCYFVNCFCLFVEFIVYQWISVKDLLGACTFCFGFDFRIKQMWKSCRNKKEPTKKKWTFKNHLCCLLMHKLKYNQNHVKRLWIGIYIWKIVYVCSRSSTIYLSFHSVMSWKNRVRIDLSPIFELEASQWSQTIHWNNKFSHFHLVFFILFCDSCQLSYIVLWFTRFKYDFLSGSEPRYITKIDRWCLFILLMFDVALVHLCENESIVTLR